MNYFGGKLRIAKYIVPIIQREIDEHGLSLYIEPFVGGANVIDKVVCDIKFGSDLNPYLIALLQRVQNGESLMDNITKEVYDDARKEWQNKPHQWNWSDWEIGNIGWLCSFSGRGFDGGYSYSGIEKKKDGTVKQRNYYEERKSNLLKQAEQPLFKEIKFKCCDYREYSPINAVIYVDPPYANTKQFANSINFNHEEFWDWCREQSERNIVLISELEAPEDFECIWQKEVSRSIKGTDKSKAVEKLFKLKDN